MCIIGMMLVIFGFFGFWIWIMDRSDKRRGRWFYKYDFITIWCLLGLLFYYIGYRHIEKNKDKFTDIEVDMMSNKIIFFVSLIVCMILGPLILFSPKKKATK